jgi:hypothetical protein
MDTSTKRFQRQANILRIENLTTHNGMKSCGECGGRRSGKTIGATCM